MSKTNPSYSSTIKAAVDDHKKTPLVEHSFASQLKGKRGLARIINASTYSVDGLKAAYRHEAAFRQVVWLNTLLLAVLFFVPFAMSLKMTLVFGSFLSLITELFNTGIEASVDYTSTDRHPLAKIAKDVGSAAQFLALLLLAVLWIMAATTIIG